MKFLRPNEEEPMKTTKRFFSVSQDFKIGLKTLLLFPPGLDWKIIFK
jgi:hypothetical protein